MVLRTSIRLRLGLYAARAVAGVGCMVCRLVGNERTFRAQAKAQPAPCAAWPDNRADGACSATVGPICMALSQHWMATATRGVDSPNQPDAGWAVELEVLPADQRSSSAPPHLLPPVHVLSIRRCCTRRSVPYTFIFLCSHWPLQGSQGRRSAVCSHARTGAGWPCYTLPDRILASFGGLFRKPRATYGKCGCGFSRREGGAVSELNFHVFATNALRAVGLSCVSDGRSPGTHYQLHQAARTRAADSHWGCCEGRLLD